MKIWLWWPSDIRGLCGPKASWHLSHRWGKTPKKPLPRNLSRTGSAAGQESMLPPAPQRWTDYRLNTFKFKITINRTYYRQNILLRVNLKLIIYMYPYFTRSYAIGIELLHNREYEWKKNYCINRSRTLLYNDMY